MDGFPYAPISLHRPAPNNRPSDGADGWTENSAHAKFSGMKAAPKNPEMRTRERKDGSGWYVLVIWGNLPSQQVGAFQSEKDAEQWIKDNSTAWIQARLR